MQIARMVISISLLSPVFALFPRQYAVERPYHRHDVVDLRGLPGGHGRHRACRAPARHDPHQRARRFAGQRGVTTSNANLTLNTVNLPVFPSNANRVALTGTASQSLSTVNAVDCSSAYDDFRGIEDSTPSGQTWAGSQ
ncbi:hypothetical protein [Paraburkholderia sp. SG-MS1]|uniref:hypothetical protein n=1 Tax=Paraburkholderia sp. SG-MS1 TaxID=2023741 RepID=UPI0014470CD9|nr:hypothetical protein [Paraburkholderia sp. SG-MS1]